MAMTAIEICSTALLKLGASPISSFTDATAEADVAAKLYPVTRDGLLRAYPWSFTMAQTVLTAETAIPAADYAHGFALPADCLRVLSAGVGKSGRGLDYRIQGSRLLADAESLTLTYQRSVPESEFPTFFTAVLVARLAAELCLPLTEGSQPGGQPLPARGGRAAPGAPARQPAVDAAPRRGLHADRGALPMTRARLVKTSFTAGELDPRLLGRLDLKAQEDGASRLRNVIVQPTGGVTRRPGHAPTWQPSPAACAWSAFDGPDGGEILVFGAFRVDVVGARRHRRHDHADAVDGGAGGRPRPGSRLDNRLLLCHPDVSPRQLVRDSATAWSMKAWRFDEQRSAAPPSPRRSSRSRRSSIRTSPCRRSMRRSRRADPIPAGNTVTLKATAPVFAPLHVGVRLLLRGRRGHDHQPYQRQPGRRPDAGGAANGQSTRDWQEQAFSLARGFPRCVGFHQNRLVIGGSRDLPDRIWMSKYRPAVRFRSRHRPRRRGDRLPSGRRAPARHRQRLRRPPAAGVHQRRRMGGQGLPADALQHPARAADRASARLPDADMPPIDVDGATLFVGATGRDLREFLFADSEQAYQAADIALLARHLMRRPGRRRLRPGPAAAAGGARRRQAAAVTLDRNSNVVAWTLLTTRRAFRAALSTGGRAISLVERAGAVFLERLDETLSLDAAVTPAPGSPRRHLGRLRPSERAHGDGGGRRLAGLCARRRRRPAHRAGRGIQRRGRAGLRRTRSRPCP